MKLIDRALPLLALVTLMVASTVVHAEAQEITLVSEVKEAIAGEAILVRYEIKGGAAQLIGMNLSLALPKGWKAYPIKPQAETVDGKKVNLEIRGSFVFYEGEPLKFATIPFSVQIPVTEDSGRRDIFPLGVVKLRVGDEVRSFTPRGKVTIYVNKWEPFVIANLSSEKVTPPAVLKLTARIFTDSPLYPVEMRNVKIRVEDSLRGNLFNDTVAYWEFGRGLDLIIPIKVNLEDPGGPQRVKIIVEYEMGDKKRLLTVEVPYEVVKKANVKFESLEIPRSMNEGDRGVINVTIINDSPFVARDVQLRYTINGRKHGRRIGDLGPGGFEFVDFPVEAEDGNITLRLWLTWRDEYPPEVRRTNVTQAVIRVERVSPSFSLERILVLVVGAVVFFAAAKYLVKRRGAEEIKGASEEEGG